MRRFLLVAVIVVCVIGVLGVLGAQLLPAPQRQYLSALAEEVPVGSLLSLAEGGLGAAPQDSTDADTEQEIVAPPRPDSRITNVLVIGSDVRTGEGNTAYGSAPGQRSDTTMIVQVNPYAKTTTVVSIPRDLWLKMPDCAGSKKAKFNTAFSLGGANCTLVLAKTLTGLNFDHVVVVDFNAFKQAVQVLGGVPVCLKRALNDPQAGLALPAGPSTLNPEQALALARSRHSTAAGSDLARIERQHYLLSRIAHEAVQRVSDPVTAFKMLSAVQPNLVVDQNFDTWAMAYLAMDAAGNAVDTVTFPWRTARSVPWGSVAIDVPRARQLVQRLKDPQAWAAQQSPTPTASVSTSPAAAPAAATSAASSSAPVGTDSTPNPGAVTSTSTSQPSTAGQPTPLETGVPCVD